MLLMLFRVSECSVDFFPYVSINEQIGILDANVLFNYYLYYVLS